MISQATVRSIPPYSERQPTAPLVTASLRPKRRSSRWTGIVSTDRLELSRRKMCEQSVGEN